MIKFPTALEIASYNLTKLEKYLIDLEAAMINESKKGFSDIAINTMSLSLTDTNRLIDILQYRNFKVDIIANGLHISWEPRK